MAEDTRKRKISFSSEYPYERWFGTEILDHKSSSIRMDFMKSGRAPLLMSHDQRLVIGVVESASIDSKEKMGRAEVRFSRSAFAEEKLRDVDDGILVNVSTGYRVHELVLEKMSDTEGDTYRVTDWEPLEASLVGIPADPTVGVGRAREVEAYTEAVKQGFATLTDVIAQTANGGREVAAPAPPEISAIPDSSPAAVAVTRKEPSMADENAAAGTNAETKVTAVQAEKQRRDAIIAVCKSNKIDSRTEAQWIADGERFEDTLDAKGNVVRKGIASQLLDVMEERGKTKPGVAASLGLSGSETNRYSLIRAIRALKFPTPANLAAAGFEIECSRAVGQKLNRGDTGSIFLPSEVLTRSMDPNVMDRAMATTPGSKGGYVVNVTNMGFIDILRNRSFAMKMGSRQLSGLDGNVTFARQTGKQSVTWQGGEGTSTSAADQALGQLSMTPKTAICVTDVSEQLLRQATPSAEQFIMADLAAVIAIDGVDNAVINGTGGAQPLGIKNTTGVTANQDAASATYAKILAFVSAAGTNNAIRGNPGWVTNTAGAAKLMQVQRFTSTDTPVWTGNMLDGQLVGFNAMSTEQVASGGLIFGSWDEVVIGDWGVLELSTDNGGTRFNQAQVGIRALWMVDVLVRYPQAFICSTNLS
jgi:HK97 family phage major capsid protein